MRIELPIIVEDHGDLNLHASVEEAELAVEAVDVRNEEFRFYDATGLVLHAEVQRVEAPRGGLGRLLAPTPELVKLTVPDGDDRRPDELADVLRSFLSRVGSARTGIPDGELAAASLWDLVGATARLLTK